MSEVLTPPWQRVAAAPQRTASSGQGCNGGKGAASAVPPAQPRKQRPKLKLGLEGIVEPATWAWDGGKRRAQVLDHDHNPPRVVRFVGWRTCLKCANPFFSDDTTKIRLCQRCKGNVDKSAAM